VSGAVAKLPPLADDPGEVEAPEDATWADAVGVTGRSDREAERGAGKWADAVGRSREELLAELPAGPTRDLNLDPPKRSFPWVALGIVSVIGSAAALWFFW
jgi:hypothetical protein